MIVIHHAPRARSLRVVWMLEEMGVPYEARAVGVFDAKSEEFLSFNPSGMLPLMEDGDVRMVESVAIMQYIGERYGPTPIVPRSDDPAWPAYLQFLHLGEASLAAMLTPVVATVVTAPEEHKANWGSQMCRQLFARRLAHVAQRLQTVPYMGGEAFTAADISVGYALGLGPLLRLDAYEPVVADYLERLKARPAWRRAIAVGKAPAAA